MSFNKWLTKYQPVQNHIDSNASFGGAMFETYGKELDFVIATESNQIWTYVDGDRGTYLVSGYHLVNRIGYLIASKPFGDHEEIQVKISN